MAISIFTILKFALVYILGMISLGLIRKFIFKGAATSLVNSLSEEDKKKLEELKEKGIITLKEFQNKTGESKFSLSKFTDNFDLTNGKLWGKTLSKFLDIRMWVILIAISLGVFWYVKTTTPLQVINAEKFVGKIIDLNHKTGMAIQFTEKGTIEKLKKQPDGKYESLGEVTLHDIPELEKELKPIGIEFRPYAIGGIGFGAEGAQIEGGIGTHIVKFYDWRLGGAVTAHKEGFGGIYGTVSYKMEKMVDWMKNTYLTVGYGTDGNSSKGIAGFTIEF